MIGMTTEQWHILGYILLWPIWIMIATVVLGLFMLFLDTIRDFFKQSWKDIGWQSLTFIVMLLSVLSILGAIYCLLK